jgi:NitT/TauT family transport system permease protein/taurine transport system permease protein
LPNIASARHFSRTRFQEFEVAAIPQLRQQGVMGSFRSRRWKRRGVDAAWFAGSFLGLGLIWYAAVALTGVPTRIFPQIGDVVDALVRVASSGQLLADLNASLQRVAIGVGLALVTGIPFGILMGSNQLISDFFTPLLRFSVAISGIAWIPLATLWLGYGPNICIFIIWNSVFFAVAYNSILGVRSIDGDLKRAARSLGASRARICTEVLLPGSLPAIITGMRVGLGYGWRGLMAAEMLATSVGLGYSLFQAQKNYDSAEIVLIMIIVGALWIVLDRAILGPLEQRTIQRWGMTRRAS